MKTAAPISLRSAAALFCLGGALASGAEIVAHRGASHDAPENTVASARLAWQQQTDAVELDIHLTQDGQLAVMHDANLKRITGRDAAIAQLPLAEIRPLDAGRWKDPKFTGEKVPTLDEMLATLPPGRRMFVEIKTGPEIMPALVAALARTRVTEKQIVLISFNYASLEAARKALPRHETLWLVDYKPSTDPAKAPPTLDQMIERCRAAGLTGLDLKHTWPLDAAATAKVRAAGLQLHVWTVDDPAIARRWVALGANGITTNRPGWMREQLQP